MTSIPLAFGLRNLLFANWPVDSDLLAAHLPERLSVDTYDETGWLSVIAFTNVDTRPRGLPAVLGVNLPQVNLRTYVTCDGDSGVYFFSLDVGSAAAVAGARLTHHLPYYRTRASLECVDGRFGFESRRRHPGSRPAYFEASYRPTGDPFTPEPGSLAAFLTARRRLYTQSQDGTLRYTALDHEPWTLHPATATVEENTLFRANGFTHPAGEPRCYFSPGLDVVTTRSKRLPRSR